MKTMTDEQFLDAIRIKTDLGYEKLTPFTKRRLKKVLQEQEITVQMYEEAGPVSKELLEELKNKEADQPSNPPVQVTPRFRSPSDNMRPFQTGGLLNRIQQEANSKDKAEELTAEKFKDIVAKMFKGMNNPHPPRRYLFGRMLETIHTQYGDEEFKEFLANNEIVTDTTGAKYVDQFIEKHKAEEDG